MDCTNAFPLMPVGVDMITINDAAVQDYVDVLAFTTCMVYAADLAYKGFAPYLAIMHGAPYICANLTQIMQVGEQFIRNQTIQYGPVLHHLSPTALRWATTITLCIALLIALS